MLFLSLESIDVRQLGGFGMAHFVRCPILEGVIGRRFHRVLNDSGRTISFRKTLPCKQVYNGKQAKKNHANYGQLDSSRL